jgi:hypothetical protein
VLADDHGLSDELRAEQLAAGVDPDEVPSRQPQAAQAPRPRPSRHLRHALAGERQDRDLGGGPYRPHVEPHDQSGTTERRARLPAWAR